MVIQAEMANVVDLTLDEFECSYRIENPEALGTNLGIKKVPRLGSKPASAKLIEARG
jgi:hypothetical protein